MRKQQVAWYMWAIGSILIALSWFGVVSNASGWIGFAVAMIGSVIGWGLRPPQDTNQDSHKESDSNVPKVNNDINKVSPSDNK